MATITRSLSSKVNSNGESEIMLRLSVSRDLRLRLKSGIFVDPSRFRDGKFIMPRADRKTLANLQTISDNLVSLESRLVSLCVNTPQNLLSKEFFEDAIMRTITRNCLRLLLSAGISSIPSMSISILHRMVQSYRAIIACWLDCWRDMRNTNENRHDRISLSNLKSSPVKWWMLSSSL